VEKNHSEIVQMLISHRADVNVLDDRGWSALDHARATKNDELANLLQEAGATANIV
jgi:ankyrin repeat protein